MKKYLLLIVAFFMYAVLPAQHQRQLPSLFGEPNNKIPVINPDENPEEKIKAYVFVKAAVSKSKVFAGEPVLAEYELYTAVDNKAKVLRQPYFPGCSVLEIEEEKERTEAYLNGLHYTVFNIRKVQIIPLQPGSIELGNASVQNVVPLLNSDGSGVESYSVTLENKPIKLEVVSLPVKNKPANFSNILGDFSIHSSIDTNNAAVGENINLNITISGSGNITGVQLPAINWPKEVEHFEFLDSQRINQNNFPLSGSKTFTIPFIIKKAGDYTIPKITFAYFNAKEVKYETVSTEPIPLTILPVQKTSITKNVVLEDVSNRKYLWIVALIAVPVLVFLVVTARKKTGEEREGNEEEKNETSLPDKEGKEETFDILSALNELGASTRQNDFLLMAKAFVTKVLQEKLQTNEASEIALINNLKLHPELKEYYSDCEKIYAVCNQNLYAMRKDENVSGEIYFSVTSLVKKMYNI